MRLAFLPVSKVHTNKYISCLLTMYVYCLHKFPEFVFSKLNFCMKNLKFTYILYMYLSCPICSIFSSPDPKGQVSYCHHLASVVVVRRTLFQKSPPLKVLDQWKPNLVWIITRVSSFKIVSGDAVHQPTWPLLLKIEHMVKLQVLGNNSKTVNNIKNLTWVKMISTSRSTYPAILK
jgi:hypothetical protein